MPSQPRTLHTYNFGALQVILAGIPISNYGPDGAVEVELPSDMLESNVSADGFVTYEANQDDRLDITVRVMETCAALPMLQVLWNAQQQAMRAGRNPPPWVFSMLCGSTGDQIVGRMVFMKEPTAGKGKSVGTREIMIQLPYARCTGRFGGVNPDLDNFRSDLYNQYSEVFEGL